MIDWERFYSLNRNTALHVAAWQERERSIEVVEMLLKNGANTNIVNVHGRTPLHNAAQVPSSYNLVC